MSAPTNTNAERPAERFSACAEVAKFYEQFGVRPTVGSRGLLGGREYVWYLPYNEPPVAVSCASNALTLGLGKLEQEVHYSTKDAPWSGKIAPHFSVNQKTGAINGDERPEGRLPIPMARQDHLFFL